MEQTTSENIFLRGPGGPGRGPGGPGRGPGGPGGFGGPGRGPGGPGGFGGPGRGPGGPGRGPGGPGGFGPGPRPPMGGGWGWRPRRPPRPYRPCCGCYIATAVYGDYDCPEVWVLRRYRDCKLETTFFGRLFVTVYYKLSPIAVKLFGRKKWFNRLCRRILDRKVAKLRAKGYNDTPYYDYQN